MAADVVSGFSSRSIAVEPSVVIIRVRVLRPGRTASFPLCTFQMDGGTGLVITGLV